MTLRNRADIREPAECHWNFTIRDTRPQETCTLAPNRCTSKGNKFQATESLNNCPGLAPVHSPLLRESHLVSCLPLIYMLKFCGGSDLESCPTSKLPHHAERAERRELKTPCLVRYLLGLSPLPLSAKSLRRARVRSSVHWPAQSTPKSCHTMTIKAGFTTDADTGEQPSAPRRCGPH